MLLNLIVFIIIVLIVGLGHIKGILITYVTFES